MNNDDYKTSIDGFRKYHYGSLTYNNIMETYSHACFGKIHPKEIRVNRATWTTLMKKIIDMCDPRYPISRIENAAIVYDPQVEEGVLEFRVLEPYEYLTTYLHINETSTVHLIEIT